MNNLNTGKLKTIKESLYLLVPEDWTKTTLGESFVWSSGGTPKRTKQDYYEGGTIPWLVIGDLNDNIVMDSYTKITDKGLRNSSAKIVEPGSLLLAMYGSIGKLGIAGLPLATNQAIAFAKPNEIVNIKYLFYFMLLMRQRLSDLGKGATQLNISQTVIKSFPFVYPSIVKQHQLVSKIEELFSELDNGIASLKTAQEQLKVYRQALLKHAFEGKLTEQWRKDNADKLETPEQLLARIQTERETRYQQQLEEWKQAVKDWEAKGKEGKKPSKPAKLKCTQRVVEQDFKIPNEWALTELSVLAYESVLGKMLDKQKNIGVDQDYLGNINVRWGCFDLNNLKQMKIEEAEESRYSLSQGDLVVCEGGEPGRCAIWKGEDGVMFIQKALHRVRFTKSYLSVFAYYYLTYAVPLERVVKHFTGTTIKHLTGAGLGKVQFPICSLAEQQEIVNKLEEKLSIIEQNEKEIESALAKAELLRQSILKRAFSGKLS